MTDGKIKISALDGTPDEIANYKTAFNAMQHPDWEKNAIQNDAAADRYLREAQTIANGDARVEIAVRLWHKFAPESSITWEDEAHKSEYLLAVDDITAGQLFNLLVARLNYDGPDTSSLTLGEVARAVDGAKLS